MHGRGTSAMFADHAAGGRAIWTWDRARHKCEQRVVRREEPVPRPLVCAVDGLGNHQDGGRRGFAKESGTTRRFLTRGNTKT